MGRWRTDVLALACIAGGAVVGAGVTAGLAARGSSHGPQHRVEMACGSGVSANVIVSMSKGDASPRTVRVMRSGECGPAVQIDMSEVRERVDRARARAEVARLEADEVRVQMEAVRERLEAVRLEMPEFEIAMPAEMVEQAQEARIEALETLLESLGDQLEAGLEDQDVQASIEGLLEALREELSQAATPAEISVTRVTPSGGSGGND